MAKNTGSNETKFKLKHNESLNPVATKTEDFSDAYLPQWNDEDQRFEESDIHLNKDNNTVNVDAKSQFNDTVTLGTEDTKVDLHINGNIIQNGESYETHAEQLFTTKDHIILREGAVAGLLDGEHSGLEILKYDGTNSIHLCVDNTGFAQVGEDPNVDSSYSYEFTDYNLFKDEDGKYYDDPRLTVEHNFYVPIGAENVEYEETSTNQNNSVNVKISYDLTEGSLQRIATIAKNAQDQSLVYYDNSFHELRTIILPEDQTKPLVPVLQGGRVTYREYTSGNGDGDANNWSGTTEEYEEAIAITDEYDEGYIKDKSGVDIFDYEQKSLCPVSSIVQQGDLNAVSSDAVAKYIASAFELDYSKQHNVSLPWTATERGLLIVRGVGTSIDIQCQIDNVDVIRLQMTNTKTTDSLEGSIYVSKNTSITVPKSTGLSTARMIPYKIQF